MGTKLLLELNRISEIMNIKNRFIINEVSVLTKGVGTLSKEAIEALVKKEVSTLIKSYLKNAIGKPGFKLSVEQVDKIANKVAKTSGGQVTAELKAEISALAASEAKTVIKTEMRAAGLVTRNGKIVSKDAANAAKVGTVPGKQAATPMKATTVTPLKVTAPTGKIYQLPSTFRIAGKDVPVGSTAQKEAKEFLEKEAASVAKLEKSKPTKFSQMVQFVKRNPRKIVLGVGAVALLYWLFKADNAEEIPAEVDPNNNTPVAPDTGNSGSGAAAGTSFRDCDLATEALTQGCRSSKIGEIQDCLNKKGAGLRVDNLFGRRTSAALTKYGYDTNVTQAVYDKIMADCGTTAATTNQGVDDPYGEYETATAEGE